MSKLVDFLAAVLLLAIVYFLVRPQSKGAELVRGIGDAMTAIVTHAADMAQ